MFCQTEGEPVTVDRVDRCAHKRYEKSKRKTTKSQFVWTQCLCRRHRCVDICSFRWHALTWNCHIDFDAKFQFAFCQVLKVPLHFWSIRNIFASHFFTSNENSFDRTWVKVVAVMQSQCDHHKLSPPIHFNIGETEKTKKYGKELSLYVVAPLSFTSTW